MGTRATKLWHPRGQSHALCHHMLMPPAPSPRAPRAERGLETPRAEHWRDRELSASTPHGISKPHEHLPVQTLPSERQRLNYEGWGPLGSLFTQGSWVGARCHGAAAGNAHTAPLSPAHTDPSVLLRALPGPFHKHSPCFGCSRDVSPASARSAPGQGSAASQGGKESSHAADLQQLWLSLQRRGGDFSRMEDISLPAPCALGGAAAPPWGASAPRKTGVFYCNRDHSSMRETKNAQNSSAELQAPSLSKQSHPDPSLGSSSQRLRGKN